MGRLVYLVYTQKGVACESGSFHFTLSKNLTQPQICI
nr:MAG TPA: hypothetical protein [Caudoviricetes sp.]